MKLNNNSIRGIYYFDNTAEYEKGDFVVYKNGLYLCKVSKESIDDENYSTYTPLNSSYFSPFPGEMLSIEEYRNSNLEDIDTSKYISSGVLATLLQDHFYYGLEDGKVKTINKDEFQTLNLSEDLSNVVNPISVLDKIGKEYNTAIFSLDYSVIEELYGTEEGNIYRDYFSPNDFVYLLQIAKESDGIILKSQQIINSSNGFHLVRAMNNQGNFGLWFTSSFDSKIIKKLFNYNKVLSSNLEALKTARRGINSTFCFKEFVIDTPSRYVDILGTDLDFINKPCIINILITSLVNEKVARSYTVSLDLNEIWTGIDNITEYYITSEAAIKASISSDNKIQLEVPENFKIKNIYYRAYE